MATGHMVALGELIDRWLDDIAPHRASYTVQEYRRLIVKTIKPALGNTRLDRLTGRQLDDFYRRLLQRGLSNSSVHQHHSIVHAALGPGVNWGIIRTNPADRASPPTLKRTTVGAPAVADVQRLIAAAESTDPVLASAIAFGAVTGARRGELCALRWSDVDQAGRKLTIARSLTVIDKIATEGPTKTHQRRDIAIDAALEAFLNKRRAR